MADLGGEASQPWLPLSRRHCEERSDDAIHLSVVARDGLLRFARNDDSYGDIAIQDYCRFCSLGADGAPESWLAEGRRFTLVAEKAAATGEVLFVIWP